MATVQSILPDFHCLLLAAGHRLAGYAAAAPLAVVVAEPHYCAGVAAVVVAFAVAAVKLHKNCDEEKLLHEDQAYSR